MQGLRDDNDIFQEMMIDYKTKEAFHADAFWKNYEQGNVRYIENFGLHDFFQKHSSFGARFSRKSLIPTIVGQCLGILINKLANHNMLPGREWRNNYLNYFKLATDNPKNIRQMYGNILYTVLRNIPGGSRIETLEDDLPGNPSEVVIVGEQKYSLPFLEYFWRVLFMQNFVSFEKTKYLFEIGMGYGGFADVVLKMYPDIRICLTDIPPQLYIAEQYLKTIFPGQVLGYRETKRLAKIDRESFGSHRVIIIPPWDIGKISADTFDGFTNHDSFAEMAPHTCEKYCSWIQPLVRDWVFILAQRQGCGGIKEPVTREHYIEFLQTFRLTKESTILKLPAKNGTFVHGDAYLFQRL